MTRPRIAIAHDYLTQRGGAERVVLTLAKAYPEAVIHTTLYDPQGTYPEFRELTIRTSPLNRVAPLRRNHRAALPFLSYAANRLRIDADLVIASSSGWAHGFPVTGLKLVYCHAPARWLYQKDAYLGRSGSSPAQSVTARALGLLTPRLKRWDEQAAASADSYVVNSTVVRQHVQHAYGIDAEPLFPPYGLDPHGGEEAIAELADWADGFHLTVSRLLPYKNVDTVVDAFAGLPEERLVVIGDGPDRQRLRDRAPENVRIVSGVTDPHLRWAYARARALVAASIEDFGLTPLEIATFGKPTIALNAGGYLDTVVPEVTGTFFDEPEPASVREAVRRASGSAWSADTIRGHADRFSERAFIDRLHARVDALLADDASR